jgi:hypothetical protein
METWQGLASKMPCAKETWSDPGAESNLLSVSCQIEPPTPTLPTLFLHGMPNIPETSHQAGGEAVLYGSSPKRILSHPVPSSFGVLA